MDRLEESFEGIVDSVQFIALAISGILTDKVSLTAGLESNQDDEEFVASLFTSSDKYNLNKIEVQSEAAERYIGYIKSESSKFDPITPSMYKKWRLFIDNATKDVGTTLYNATNYLNEKMITSDDFVEIQKAVAVYENILLEINQCFYVYNTNPINRVKPGFVELGRVNMVVQPKLL